MKTLSRFVTQFSSLIVAVLACLDRVNCAHALRVIAVNLSFRPAAAHTHLVLADHTGRPAHGGKSTEQARVPCRPRTHDPPPAIECHSDACPIFSPSVQFPP
jgi:hypothetical protein